MNQISPENFFINLKTISKLKIKDKFYINFQYHIIVVKNDLYQGLHRRFFGEGRNKNMDELNDFYSNIIMYIEDKLHSKYLYDNPNLTELENETHINLTYILKRMEIELENSKNGLENLKLTYSGDILIESKIDNIINNIDNIIDKLNKKLN